MLSLRMSPIPKSSLSMLVALVLAFSGSTMARAQDADGAGPVEVIETPWQGVITGQIEAFRTGDAPGAFQYAGSAFQSRFPSAEVFFVAIIASGYSPIAESRTHSFGSFQVMGEKLVLQSVRLSGGDQSLYEAIYQLAEEPAGWRVQGVQLTKLSAMAI